MNSTEISPATTLLEDMVKPTRGGIWRRWKLRFQLFYTRILNKYLRLECCYLRFKMRRLDKRCVKLILQVKTTRGWHVQYPPNE